MYVAECTLIALLIAVGAIIGLDSNPVETGKAFSSLIVALVAALGIFANLRFNQRKHRDELYTIESRERAEREMAFRKEVFVEVCDAASRLFVTFRRFKLRDFNWDQYWDAVQRWSGAVAKVHVVADTPLIAALQNIQQITFPTQQVLVRLRQSYDLQLRLLSVLEKGFEANPTLRAEEDERAASLRSMEEKAEAIIERITRAMDQAAGEFSKRIGAGHTEMIIAMKAELSYFGFDEASYRAQMLKFDAAVRQMVSSVARTHSNGAGEP